MHHYSWYCTRLVLYAGIKAFNSEAKSPKLQFVFCNLYMHMHFILTKTNGTMNKSNSTIFISTFVFMDSTNMLYLHLLMNNN